MLVAVFGVSPIELPPRKSRFQRLTSIYGSWPVPHFVKLEDIGW